MIIRKNQPEAELNEGEWDGTDIEPSYTVVAVETKEDQDGDYFRSYHEGDRVS